MPRAYLSLQRQGDFTRLHRRGKRFSAPSFMLYAARTSRGVSISRISVSVSKAVGKAVCRNLVRRRVQCAFDTFGPEAYAQMDLLVVAKASAAGASYDTMAADLKAAVAAVRRLV